MNILFFLSPKQDLMYVYDDFTLRQTLEKWENNRYASIPVLNRKGEYVGTLTEGDILWGLKKFHGLDLEAAEDIPIRDFAHKRDYKAVTVTTSMDQLIEAAMNQNFVPVVDDRGMFIGIVRRQAIIRYCYDRSRAAAAEQRRKPEKQGKTSPGFCRGAVKQEKAPPLCMKCAGQRGLSMPVGRGERCFSPR